MLDMLQPTINVGFLIWEKFVAEESTNRPKRRLRKSETVREKAEKTVAAEEKPRRVRKSARVAGAPFRAAGRAGNRLGKIKVFHIVSLVLVPRYFRNSWKELRQVTWPTWRESRRLAGAVILFAIVFGILVAVVDFGLDKLFKQVLLK
jgi:preprotein translocase SecE subunit